MHPLALLFFPIFGFGFVLYFVPTIVAFARSKRDAVSILVLDIFFQGEATRNLLVPREEADSSPLKRFGMTSAVAMLSQQRRRLFRVVSKNNSRPGPPNRRQRFQNHPLAVDPITSCCGLNHRVLA